jgi:hypothetical protein
LCRRQVRRATNQLWLDEPFALGQLLLGVRPARCSCRELAFAVGAMVLLMVVTVNFLPVVLPPLIPGVAVDPWKIVRLVERATAIRANRGSAFKLNASLCEVKGPLCRALINKPCFTPRTIRNQLRATANNESL